MANFTQDIKDSHEEIAEVAEATADVVDPVVATDVATWDIERNAGLEKVSSKSLSNIELQVLADEDPEVSAWINSVGGPKDYMTGKGMSFDEFASEWQATGIDRAPTQEEYENWITHGSKGQLASELGQGEFWHNLDLGALLGEGAEGLSADAYSLASMQYAIDNNIKVDFSRVEDGDYILLPTEVDAMGRYKHIAETVGPDGNDYVLYQKQEKEDWYEEDWIAPVIMAASVFGGPLLSGAIGGLVGGVVGTTGIGGITSSAVGGAITGGVTSGLMAESMGGEFWDGFGDGALTGGVGGAITGVGDISGIASELDLTETQTALLFGGATVGTELLLGAELDDALISGAASGLSVSAGDDPLTQAGIAAGRTAALGGDLSQVLQAGGWAYAGTSFSNSRNNPNNTDASNKIGASAFKGGLSDVDRAKAIAKMTFGNKPTSALELEALALDQAIEESLVVEGEL